MNRKVKIRRVIFIPEDMDKELDNEADKRLREADRMGRQTIGSMSRDIVCLALKMSMQEIKKMSKEEFKIECKRLQT